MNPLALPGIPLIGALLLVLLMGGPTIGYLRSRKSIQPISPDAPEKHRLKHGTPTMGGLLLLVAVTVVLTASLFAWTGYLSGERRGRLIAVLLTFLGGGIVGILDDLGKARKKENKAGLSERAKLALQLVVAGGFCGFLYATHHDTRIFGVDLRLWYYPLALLYLIAFSNAVNFTDGLDGLLSGTSLIAAAALALSTDPARPELGLFYGAVAGACGGFLWFNAYPARIFMGDTGSLGLGMGFSAAALAAKQEVLFLVVGVIFLAEIASMMIQRYVFKYRRIRFGLEYAQKNRVFRRAPIHHHFEELGWHETQVVQRFWVIALLAATIGVILLGGHD